MEDKGDKKDKSPNKEENNEDLGDVNYKKNEWFKEKDDSSRFTNKQKNSKKIIKRSFQEK